MSNLTIIIVCASILLAGWLLRRYQDGAPPFKKKTPHTKQAPTQTLSKRFGGSVSLYERVSQTFPKHVIKQKIGDKNCVFLCDPAVGNGDANEIAIVKVKPVAEKQVKTMGGLISVTYDMMPSKRELKKDLTSVL